MEQQNVPTENGAAGFPLETIVMSGGVDLMAFCTANDERLASPFTVGGHTLFSNGRCVVRVPVIDSVDRDSPFDSISKIKFEAPTGGKFIPMPTVRVEMKTCGCCLGSGMATSCEECGGEGEVVFTTENNIYEVECKECFGDGLTAGGNETCRECNGSKVTPKYRHETVRIFGTRFAADLLEMFQVLPNMEICSKPHKELMFYFRFDGGDGVLMGMSD
jgi:hypothetical protein